MSLLVVLVTRSGPYTSLVVHPLALLWWSPRSQRLLILPCLWSLPAHGFDTPACLVSPAIALLACPFTRSHGIAFLSSPPRLGPVPIRGTFPRYSDPGQEPYRLLLSMVQASALLPHPYTVSTMFLSDQSPFFALLVWCSLLALHFLVHLTRNNTPF